MGILDRWLRPPPALHVAGDTADPERAGEGVPVTPADAPGPVVVMIHGIASSSVTFQNLVPLLSPAHRCITIDLLGFGRSPAPADATYTLEEHTAAVEAAIRELRLREPFVLVGHSLGSLIATRYAATHRRELDRLVLVSPPIYLPPSVIGDQRDRASMGLYFTVYEFMRANQQFTTATAAALGRIAPIKNVLEVTERNWQAFVLSLQNAIETQTTIADLASVPVAVDIVYGTLDPFLAPGGLKIAEQLRHVTTTRVNGVDHLVRRKLARAVARIIDAPPAAPAPPA